MIAKNQELLRLQDVLFQLVEDEFLAMLAGEFTPLGPELQASLLRISQQAVQAQRNWEPRRIERLGRFLCMRLPLSMTLGAVEGLPWQRRRKQQLC